MVLINWLIHECHFLILNAICFITYLLIIEAEGGWWALWVAKAQPKFAITNWIHTTIFWNFARNMNITSFCRQCCTCHYTYVTSNNTQISNKNQLSKKRFAKPSVAQLAQNLYCISISKFEVSFLGMSNQSLTLARYERSIISNGMKHRGWNQK